LEVGISTHTKRLTSRLVKATAGLVKSTKKLRSGVRLVAPTLKEGIGEKTLDTKKGFLSLRKSMIAMFRRPLSDVSHLSIVLVIILALLSGLSTISLGTDSVSANPFQPAQQAASAYVSVDEKRALEADSVATVAGWYSDKLGQDAAATAEVLNTDLNTMGTRIESIASVPIVSTGDSTPGQGTSVTSYVVQNGDTLSTIADKFSISTDTVRYANGIEDIDNLKPGQTLNILPVTGVLHTVLSGDTLAGIAGRYKVAEAIIVSTNDLYGVDLTEGMKLLIPDGEIPEAPKPKPVVVEEKQSGGGGSSGSRNSIGSTGDFMFPTVNRGYYNGYHNWAIDIQGSIGTPIYAADSGRIVEAKYGYNGGYGNTILIDHGNGYQTRYAHMSSLNIIDGYVSKGQVIGFMGSTGRSTGSHLHFEIITGGTRLNPCGFFGGCSG
jgi:murein DD-endopeptidase MepM/ murein hydrolase activator NlpD